MVKINYKEFKILGSRIAYYRRLKHLSQDNLADIVGISKSYLSKIERAALDSISLGTVILIAKGLNVPVYMLLKFDEVEITVLNGDKKKFDSNDEFNKES